MDRKNIAEDVLKDFRPLRFGIEDTVLREWTDNPELLHAPRQTKSYIVEVRCSSDAACADTAGITVPVNCPASGNLGGFPTLVATDPTTLEWATELAYDYGKGWLTDLGTYATIENGQNQTPATFMNIAADEPADGTGFWYLFRQPGPLGGETVYCNAPGNTWGDPTRDDTLP